MIETTSTTTITCDNCGRTIAEGEQWFQVSQSASVGVFAGTASGLEQLSAVILQLCADDYAASGKVLATVAPRRAEPPTLIPAVPETP